MDSLTDRLHRLVTAPLFTDLSADRAAIVAALAAGAELVAPGDLVVPGEAAEILGKDRTTISRWSREGYMPEPLQRVMLRGASGVPVWPRARIVAFGEQHRARSDTAGRRPVGTR